MFVTQLTQLNCANISHNKLQQNPKYTEPSKGRLYCLFIQLLICKNTNVLFDVRSGIVLL